MNGNWNQLKSFARGQWGRLTAANAGRLAGKRRKKQLAEWLAREHKTDPIHK